MSEDLISDIRKRHEHDKLITDNLHFPEQYWTRARVGQKAHDDRGCLLAEVEKLRAALDAVVRDRDEARAEVERLRAALKIAAVYVMSCYHEWHVPRDRAEALRDLTKIRVVLNDESAGEPEAKP